MMLLVVVGVVVLGAVISQSEAMSCVYDLADDTETQDDCMTIFDWSPVNVACQVASIIYKSR